MKSWYVLKTKAHREFFVREQLVGRGIENYLPLWRPAQLNNLDKNLKPYFPSYLFAKVDLEMVSLSSLKYLPGVNHMLLCDGIPVRVEQCVIDAIVDRVSLLENSVTDTTGKLLGHGDKVKITGGVLEGYDAIFDKRLAGGDRVRILIDFLQRRTVLSIERNLIQKQGAGSAFSSPSHPRKRY
jgi:transcriptional antiterminator RfaH